MPMTGFDELLKLAERCEKATGPDRELDRLIEETMPDVRRHPYDDMVKDGYVMLGPQAYLAPHYTSSIDAAVTLTPEGWHWRLDQGRNAGAAMYHVGFPQHFSVADSPALALCAAALRARAPTVVLHERGTP